MILVYIHVWLDMDSHLCTVDSKLEKSHPAAGCQVHELSMCNVMIVGLVCETGHLLFNNLLLTHTAADDLFEITEYLLKLKKIDIYNLGLTLGLNHFHLKDMENSETYRDDMIAAWLVKEDQVTTRGLPTWETLEKALRHNRVGQTGVANEINAERIATK